ncbi:hypothetical protein [Hymenobacter aerophilus]|uniref:hypothetical protein n=1 Tax=Hymenobacter aerophilus TaxID=119644 RepID=UPI0012FB5471|nr:hypothetical protein [Hymenobacter aerophilus]
MAKAKFDLDQLIPSPDELLLKPKATVASVASTVAQEAKESVLIKFSNQLPAETLQRLQQFSFWSHETIGDVLDAAITAYLEGKPEADRALPAKQAARRRRG